jgi:glycine cleavage system H protein
MHFIMNIPATKYTKDHEWVSLEGDVANCRNHAFCSKKELGDIVYVEVETFRIKLGKR